MSTIPSFNTNLGLAATPDTTNPELFAVAMPIYNALRSLAGSLDASTGTSFVAPADYETKLPTATLLVSNLAHMYVKCAVAIAAGRTVALDTSGSAVLGTSGTVLGYAAQEGAVGEYIKVVLQGYWPVGAVVPGTLYRASATAGGFTASGAGQPLGFAISTKAIYFNPSLT